MGIFKATLTLAVAFAGLAVTTSGCKTPNSGSRVKDADEGAAAPCDVDRGTWAGRMGMLLRDGNGGAVIDCVVVGEGLHHIGLHPGDQITALNGGLKVDSARGFEAAAKTLAVNADKRVKHFEFTVNGKVVKPKDDYPGCGLFTYDDCGPLGQ